MKKSLSRQITVIFLAVVMGVLIVYLLANNFFLEDYHIYRLERSLESMYEQVDKNTDEDGIEDYFLERTFREECIRGNVTPVIVNPYTNEVIFSLNVQEASLMSVRLFGNFSGLEKNDGVKVLRRTDAYTTQLKTDDYVGIPYLEIWGTLNNGYYIMMRIPYNSIRDNAAITNRFFLYIGVIAMIISAILIWGLSKRITRPIRELTDLSKRMANLDFDARYVSGGENEVGQLGDHFNRMSSTLEQTISQLKSANAKLQKDIEQKTQIDEMRREFLSNVSHELKTPIALIQGYAEGLQDCVNDDEESRQYYCEVIADEAQKMNTMVRQLLTLNQLEFGQEAMTMERFDLAALIRGKVEACRILADQKGAVISVEGKDCVHVWGDEFRIEEVLTNYLSNALNHVGGEGRIVIDYRLKDEEGGLGGQSGSTGEQNVLPGSAGQHEGRSGGIEAENRKIRVTVFNTGTQIPEESIPHLWDKFYKVDKARTREYGGSGVGLSIVKAIMDSHHQKVGVENRPDGVAFWFELDCADAEENS
ncbi:MAG: HAMP domain-containing protein [Lachnospiraceae bacterium]|nr:HAMP domain-containing protein [Lachnospiraceae bacterium]